MRVSGNANQSGDIGIIAAEERASRREILSGSRSHAERRNELRTKKREGDYLAFASLEVIRTIYTLNSGRRLASWVCSRATMLECIWLTRDSLKSSVAPISFIVMSS